MKQRSNIYNMKNTKQIIKTTSNQVLKAVLTLMHDQIIARKNETIKFEEKITKRKVSEFGKEIIELSLIYDLCKSVIVYTNDNDVVKEFTSGISKKGNFEIYGTITRDGQDYSFSTEAIFAGGYNVQRLHIRYITKTKLPKANNLIIAAQIKTELKRLNKIQRIEKEIERLESQNKKYTEQIAMYLSFSENQWVEFCNTKRDHKLITNRFTKETFEPFNSFRTFQEYSKFVIEANKSTIDFAKKHFIEWPQTWLSRSEKSLIKENKKLELAI